ncbi:MAG: hypothetical protein JSV86_10535 [Gemmatimonadota bacterium]|nr:MAG: hypothetical protein JSV86_10535 [Gemmatimonadota bacterium]
MSGDNTACEHVRGLTIDGVCIYCWRERALKAEAALRACVHESDGRVYTSMPPQYRCAKCGKFYR